MKDTHRQRGLRMRLVQELKKKGVRDERILRAFEAIPRHYFVDSAFDALAYRDAPFPIECNQTISTPYTVAMQTSLLAVQTGDKILEIGTGSGFQAAVLSYLGARVYTIERHRPLYEKTDALLRTMGYGRIRTMYGDGMKGLQSRAPFDKIIVTAGAMDVPQALLDQLTIGGRLVIPVGEGTQEMYRIWRTAETKYRRERHGAYQFVPLLAGEV